ncbi:MAG: glucose 1-dehydrogenase [bacterium]|nr:glucose 1-dehydrogenase [bacterium]MCP5042200.1 glucose 1-dehydrogenase [bacterium]
MAGRFDGKVVIVTGAAGGIGLAAVERFAREGARVTAVDLAGAALERVVDVAKAAGSEALAVEADVTQPDDVQHYVDETVARFGGVDALFNNAGIEGVVCPVDQYPLDVFQKVMAVNVTGVFLGMKAVVPALRARGGGAIVNTASVAGVTGNALIPAYVASKHAVVGLSRSGGQTYAAENIRVNAVCPSPIETRMMRSLEQGVAADSPEAAKQLMTAAIPAGRYGSPEEVAALVAFLCSDDAVFINGSVYTIDGAMTPS